jgi:hypothetical protein
MRCPRLICLWPDRAKGVYPAKPLIPILVGLLIFESDRSSALGTRPVKATLRGVVQIVEHRTYGQAYGQCIRAS